jgi:diacylglycerol O-acyltransferase 1
MECLFADVGLPSGLQGFFGGALGLVGELLCFADQRFYKAWWNAEDAGEFWRCWNLPVTNFCMRHIHGPIVEMTGGWRKLGMTTTFSISAVLHELLIMVRHQPRSLRG